MDVNVFKIAEVTNEQILQKIKNHESFTLECGDAERYSRTLEWLEKNIEDQGMKVRIYMVGRAAAMGAAVWTGFGTIAAAASGIAIAAHNIATWSPDYEIGKNPISPTLYVNYKK
ncbi:hypothetical protein [Pseudomonas sp. NPDC090201]|uniref:hypothetical protein n=1 Tax=Pseudomonas sp. NPDC090201 TaxID=3364475 RepID=UPI003822574E